MYLEPHSRFYQSLIGTLNTLSLIYKSASWLVLKKRSLKPKAYEDSYIISVDNLSFGGTGKTALVIALGQYLNQRNIGFAVILRGYRSLYQKKGTRVLPGHGLEEVGDEAVLYRHYFPGRDIFIGRNRRLSIDQARLRNNRIMILDDGFQSASIKKNLKIMLINPAHPYYYLRHFKFMMGGEDIILRYGAGPADATRSFPLESGYCFSPAGFFDPGNRPLDIRGAAIVGFSALGDNPRYERDLSLYNLKEFRAFRDHHSYTREDIRGLERLRNRHRASYLVCTEKDFVKLAHLNLTGIPLIYLKNKLQLKDDIFSMIVDHARERGFI